MSHPINQRVQKHRDALRAAGLRPVQFWVMDTRLPGFIEEARRQSLLANQTDAADTQLGSLLDDALTDLDDWTA